MQLPAGLKIGDGAVTLTNNDAGGSISMLMIFELHAVAVDDVAFINNILHLQINFIVLITFSPLLPAIFLLVGIIFLNPRFYAPTTIAIVSHSVF